jgi:glycosyltransferase involved in cell wall biosynthesis
MRPSLYELIHCLVITYNRAENLRNTLTRLAASPFRETRITVLDNASTDATPAVTAEFAARFSHYQVIRHPYNIGGPCNLMRAFELSQARYTWVLGDDDQLNPVDIGDVHDVMAAESADVISLSLFRRPETMSGNFYTYEESVRAGVFFFSCFSQITNTVFKTSLLDSRLMHQGYRLAHTLFTQFPLLIKLAVENRRIYCAREVVITRSFYDGPTWTAADLWIGWVEVCALIPSPVIRERALQDYFGNPKPLWLVLPKVILQSHAQELGQTPLFRRSARFLSLLARATTILTCWICLLPPGCIRAVLKVLYRLAGRPYDFMPPPEGPGAAMDILRQ